METLTGVMHPHDATYAIRRQSLIQNALKMSVKELDLQLRYMMQQPAPREENGVTAGRVVGEIMNDPFVPDKVKAGILDSTSGTTGSVLIRQDLEPVLYALFVKTFPAWERLAKAPSNGLVHATNQITTPDSSALGSTAISELGTVTYVSSTYNRVTFPIAVMATGRGVGFKEIAAVSAGGAPYDPQKTELANGMIKLATDAQYFLLQGNATNNPGSLTTEQGLYNANAFDGFRSVLGSVTGFTANNAIQQDISTLNITESLQLAAAKSANNGGMPTCVLMSMLAKQAMDTENQNNQRYNDDMVEIIPGVKVIQLQWANGLLTIIPVPGNMMGSYNRTSDNALVEDMYVLDERTVTLRWLYSESFTVLQIPAGVDGVLSNRFIPFHMYGLEQAAPVFNSKVRRLYS